MPALRYADDPQRVDFHNRLLERLRSLPGVLAAGAIQTLPLAAESDTATIHVENRPVPPGRPEHSAEYRFISPEYLRAMGIPLLQGRDFSGSDTLGSPLVALVDEKAARRFWPGENPIGKRLGFGPALWREVVGMVGSVRNRGLDVTGQEQVYFPLFQRSPSTISYVLHTGDAPLSMTPEIRRAVQSIDATLPIYDVRPMEEYVSDWMAGRRLATSLVVVFATFAILLAAVGIYGVLASWVRQRMHEIGIRMAMGARPAQVFHLVVAQGMVMALIGIALGGLGTIAATRLLESLLFGVQPQDPFTFLAVAALLLGVAFLACYLPARRAMNVDPLVVLRHE